MLETWRWFGPEDPVTLEQALQAGTKGIVTALHHMATGNAWPEEEIVQRRQEIESRGLKWSVVESIPVHNEIKTRSGNFQNHIENYKTSIRHVGAAGIPVICYNFMPVVDWTRTNLMYKLPNTSRALRFEMADFAAYDLYILQRENSAADYDRKTLAAARQQFDTMDGQATALLEKNIIAGLPGGEGSYNRDGIRSAITEFIALGTEGLRANLLAFLKEVIPVAEEAGVRLCIHPDDPPFPLFGLPRIVSTAEDIRTLLQAVPSASNGLTLCTGSLGARADNNLVAMVQEFGPSIHFAHLRNIKRETSGSFYESDHLDGDNDMVGIIRALLDEEERRRNTTDRFHTIPMRPDHGHLLGDEANQESPYPGYSFAGRMKGLAELRGVIHALTSLKGAVNDDT